MSIGGIGGGFNFYNNQPAKKTNGTKQDDMLKKLNDVGKDIPLKPATESDGPKPWINRL